LTRSQMAFIRGVFGKVVMIRSPSDLNTSPNAVVKTGSRSWMQEPQRAEAVTQVHGKVAGLLRRPRPGRSRGHPGQVQPAGAVLDEHQHVQPLAQHRLHDQEVTGDDGVAWAVRNCRQVGPARRGAGSMPAACSISRTVDAAIACPSRASSPWILRWPPGRVLPRHPDDLRLDRGSGGGSSRPTVAGVVPLTGDEVTMPAQDGGRGDREDLAAAHQPGQSRKPQPVGMIPAQPPCQLTAQHLVLVTQHEQLGLLRQVRAGQHRQQAEQAPHQAVDERQQHPEMVPATLLNPQRNPSSRHETEFPSGTPPRSSACRPSPPADQPEAIPATREGHQTGPVEPRPPGATAGPQR
jgi:hypothetical protein